MHLHHDSLACHWHRVLWHFDSGMRRNQNFKTRKWPTSWGFSIFGILFLPFLFLLFFLFAAVIDLLMGLLAVKKLLRKHHRGGNFYHGAARCSGRKFWSEFFAPLFDHFCAYLRLHSANHSDLGITGKIFFSCRSWAQIMPILVKVMTSEVEERPRLVTAG